MPSVLSLMQSFFTEVHQVRGTGAGTPETSYYPALRNLLSGLGGTLKPKVDAVMNLRNRGAGLPDGGLFPRDQRVGDDPDWEAIVPGRGVLEVKAPGHDMQTLAQSEQVARYARRYGLVLCTNLHEYRLVRVDAHDHPETVERHVVKGTADEFWAMCRHPKKAAQEQGDRLAEFLLRVMQFESELTRPEDVAWFLASYAKEAKVRVDERAELPALASLRGSLEQALGIRFDDEKGEHLFRSTLVQTLFYGVFSAWVLWHRENPSRRDSFDWKDAAWSLRVEVIKTLFEQVATPSQLGPLKLVTVMDLAGAVLNRVHRGRFFSSFREEDAVQYFYEPFLQRFDPDLRKELGVWYTPPEVVRYMVGKVDQTLREELGIAKGLADESVVVLDPCCGTGAFLVEVLRKIHASLGDDGLAANDLKNAATKRVFGFELLPAPFVVAHLQLGLQLQTAGAPLGDGERAGVYLTNALTGWEAREQDMQIQYPAFEQERDAAQHVKRDEPILVILGNPPYNAYAGVSPKEEGGLVDPYKQGLNTPVKEGGWGIKKFNLDELYVRFFRIAERRIAKSGRGVVCFISSNSYLSEPSFVVMRKSLLGTFDTLTFDNLNGDSRETGKRTPDGEPDPSIFSTKYNRAGIRVGTAIGTLVKRAEKVASARVSYREFWGIDKRQELDNVAAGSLDRPFLVAKPEQRNRLCLKPLQISEDYLNWPTIDAFAMRPPLSGPIERRGNLLIEIDGKQPLVDRICAYLDPSVTLQKLAVVEPRFTTSTGEFDAANARRLILGRNLSIGSLLPTPYPFKPFDVRSALRSPELAPLFSRPGPEFQHIDRLPSNAFLITRKRRHTVPEGAPFLFSRLVCDYDSVSGHAQHFPFLVTETFAPDNAPLLESSSVTRSVVANLSIVAREYLASLGIADPDGDAETACLIWMHALAIGFSPAYLDENADGVKQDWPRIPLPRKRDQFEASAALGKRLAELLDTEAGVKGVTLESDRPYKLFGNIGRDDGASIDPSAGDLAVTARWGYTQKSGAVFPGPGDARPRKWDEDERDALGEAADVLAGEDAEAYDVYLNDRTRWAAVPGAVWEYHLGGYQVVKKWLSYRQRDVLGRDLSPDEAREVTATVRRLAGLVLMRTALDENYRAVAADTATWPGMVLGEIT